MNSVVVTHPKPNNQGPCQDAPQIHSENNQEGAVGHLRYAEIGFKDLVFRGTLGGADDVKGAVALSAEGVNSENGRSPTMLGRVGKQWLALRNLVNESEGFASEDERSRILGELKNSIQFCKKLASEMSGTEMVASIDFIGNLDALAATLEGDCVDSEDPQNFKALKTIFNHFDKRSGLHEVIESLDKVGMLREARENIHAKLQDVIAVVNEGVDQATAIVAENKVRRLPCGVKNEAGWAGIAKLKIPEKFRAVLEPLFMVLPNNPTIRKARDRYESKIDVIENDIRTMTSPSTFAQRLRGIRTELNQADKWSSKHFG